MNLAKKIDKMNEALGERLLSAVGLGLKQSYGVIGLGSLASLSISRAAHIAGFGHRPKHMGRSKAAKDIAAKARDLVEALEHYNAEWPPERLYLTHELMPKLIGEDPQTKKHKNFTAERLKWLRGIAHDYEFEADEAKKYAVTANGLSEFIRTYLAPGFEHLFGQEAAVKYDAHSDALYSGPFLAYARFILDEAGADITDAAIEKAVRRKKP